MKTRKLFTLSSEVAEFLDKQPNQSGLVDRLIKEYSHREVRHDYVWQIVSNYVIDNTKLGTEVSIIAHISMLLTDAITGKDVLPEIMERVEK